MAERQAQEQELARAARAEQAAADADLAKVQAMLDQAQEQAAHELAEQRRRSDEYQRLLKMDSRSLLAEVRRMRDRLPSVPDLMSRDHEYGGTRSRPACRRSAGAGPGRPGPGRPGCRRLARWAPAADMGA